jgi:DNA-binding response OmpR family regulator
MSAVQASRTIVVVETDKSMCELLERWLVDAGFGVVFSESGRGPGFKDDPELLIADVSVPHLAQARIRDLRAIWAAPILLISGRFRRDVGESRHVADSLGVRMVLPKPFTREELLAAVAQSIRENK